MRTTSKTNRKRLAVVTRIRQSAGRAASSIDLTSRREDRPQWRWQDGSVDRDKEHIELRYGDAAKQRSKDWCPVALIGKPDNHVFPVAWLIDADRTDRRRMIAAVRKDLDFYLLQLREPDPWRYAQYHCNTSANMYSKVHWSYFPDGETGKRISSMVIRVKRSSARGASVKRRS